MYFYFILLAVVLVLADYVKYKGVGKTYRDRAWRLIAWIVSRRHVSAWLIARAMRTPDTHLTGYMNRYWLFNPLTWLDGEKVKRFPRLPSIGVHHILRADHDRHLHDHPWDAARTIILKGFYTEERSVERVPYLRLPGDTATLKFGEYHTITSVATGGVWTLFFTYGYQQMWGFLVDGTKVPWPEYKQQHPEKPWASENPDAS